MAVSEPARPNASGVREFFRVVGSSWGSLMSGILSVPFTALAVFTTPEYGKPIWTGLAACAWLATTYQIWARERKALIREHDLNSRPRISVQIIGGTFERSPVTLSGQRNGQAVQEYVGCITLVCSFINHSPQAASIGKRRLIIKTLKWKDIPGVTIEDVQRLDQPMYHHIFPGNVKLENPVEPTGVSKMESDVTLNFGLAATRFLQFYVEAWDDDAYATTELHLTVIDSFGGEWQASVPASALKRIPLQTQRFTKPGTHN
jgi:hypothetical protein